MTRRVANLDNPQPGLFDQDEPSVALTPMQRAHLTTPVATLLIEIAVALATGEAGDAQDQRGASRPQCLCLHSAADQLVHNQESQRRQYGLADRARQLGWTTVEVIDDDLGRSGSGVSRPGFERMLAAICEGRAGAVFAIEVS